MPDEKVVQPEAVQPVTRPEGAAAQDGQTPLEGQGPAAAPPGGAAPPVVPPVMPPAAPPVVPPREKTVAELVQEYDRTVKLNAIVRVSFPVLVLSLIVVFLIAIWLEIASAFPEKRVTEETVKAGEEVLPVLNSLLKTFADEVAPELAEEFQKGLEKGSEKLVEAISVEIEKMEKGTGDYIKTKVHETVELARTDHEKLVLEVFPELKADPKRLALTVDRLNKAFEMWTAHYMLTVMEDYYIAMAKINDTVIRNYRPKPPAPGETQKVQEAEMLELFMELINSAYAEEPEAGAAPAAKPSPGAPPAAAPASGAAAPAPATAKGAEAAPAAPPVPATQPETPVK